MRVTGGAQLDALLREAEAIGGTLKVAGAKRVLGRAIANVLRAHFRKLANDSQHHRSADNLGAKRTGFYADAARSVQQPNVELDGVSVAVNKLGLRQRLFGGIIKPKRSKFLTIPARMEAYGKRAGEFDNLRAIMFPSGGGALVERDATAVKGETGSTIGGGVFFWLVKQVSQKPDPTVLPGDEEMIEAALTAGGTLVDQMLERRLRA